MRLLRKHSQRWARNYFLVCRNREKGERTRSNILAQTGNERVTLLIGDLSSLKEVRQIAKSFLSYEKPLHLLLNNAGIVNLKREISVDGYEEMFAVNHLSHFLLTNLLLDRIKQSAPARIVNVSSEGHIMVKGINFDDLSFKEGFSAMKVYGHSKLANLLFNLELSKQLGRLRSDGKRNTPWHSSYWSRFTKWETWESY